MLTIADSGAEISDCGCYRYLLWRRWAPQPASCAVFLMLNASTADWELNDPTIRRCMGFARGWGLGGILVGNLYGWRATDPAEMWAAQAAGEDIVGPHNDERLRLMAATAAWSGDPLIGAWGAGADPARVTQVLGLDSAMRRMQCLGLTRGGQPRHPLYLPAATELQPWPGMTAARPEVRCE